MQRVQSSTLSTLRISEEPSTWWSATLYFKPSTIKEWISCTFVSLKTSFPILFFSITLFDRPIRIKVEKGVKQGDICSPKAFTAALEGALRKMDAPNSLRIDGEHLQMLLFADDVVLIADDPEKLQLMLDELNDKTKAIELSINSTKRNG